MSNTNKQTQTQDYLNLLYTGQLVSLYWDRLTEHLQSVVLEKVRSHPYAMLKLYVTNLI